MLTLGAWQFSKYQVETRTGLRFEASRDRAVGLIIDRMEKYEDALWAGVAAIESHCGDISHREWQIYAKTLRIDEKYPGINGIGVIHFETGQTLADYLALQRVERPDFRIFPAHDQNIYMPITFVEPQATNRAAIGLDVAHEVNRRTAALASRDTGDAQITGPITLVQDADSTPGFLFYAPFYRDSPPADISGRRERFLGAVYAPFVVHKLMEGLLARELRDVRFSITDGDQVIYDEHLSEVPDSDPNPMFSEQLTINLYGRSWQVDMRTDQLFRTENTHSQPLAILIAGLVIEALIISLLFFMSRANKRAVDYADQVTAELKQQSIKLAATNDELSRKNDEVEQFVYLTSHDLKTPVRGIGTLAEMMEEDLAEYFGTDSANPDVAANLGLIQDRVHRMNQMIKGLLGFCQIGTGETEGGQLALKEVIEALKLDFGLKGDQLIFRGTVDDINTDTLNFRCVLENLVGNSIKYHNNPNSLKITVSVRQNGDRYCVAVSDNGPGIDAKHHGKVFDFFQTLRESDAVESTGMGLSIVKKAVERHGGKVAITSSLGEGATFEFDWPAHKLAEMTDEMSNAA